MLLMGHGFFNFFKGGQWKKSLGNPDQEAKHNMFVILIGCALCGDFTRTTIILKHTKNCTKRSKDIF